MGDSYVDICFLIEVIEHLKDESIDKTLREIYRVLKNNGHLVLTTPNKEDLELSKVLCPECGCIFHKMQHLHSWDSDRLRNIVCSYGFYEVNIIETNFFRTAKYTHGYFTIH